MSSRARIDVRRVSVAVLAWVFGLSTTVFLIGGWGRSITGSQTTLTDSIQELAATELVTERVVDWVDDGLAAAARVPVPEARRALLEVAALPEADVAVETIIAQAIRAAFADPGEEARVDVASALMPLTQEIVSRLDVPPEAAAGVAAAVGSLPPLEVDGGDPASPLAGVSRARSILTWSLLAGLAGMIVAGAAVIALSSDRVRTLRSLVLRVMVSAGTFAIILRVGAWAVDPEAGRSPVRESGAILLGRHWFVPFVVAMGALAAAAGLTLWLWRRRQSVASGSIEPQRWLPVPATSWDVEEDDPTAELEPVGARY